MNNPVRMRPVFLKSKMMFPVSLVLITTEIITYSFIADEEVGGHDGMEKYVVSKEFKDLNIGFALDEGLASEDNAIPVFPEVASTRTVSFFIFPESIAEFTIYFITLSFIDPVGL